MAKDINNMQDESQESEQLEAQLESSMTEDDKAAFAAAFEGFQNIGNSIKNVIQGMNEVKESLKPIVEQLPDIFQEIMHLQQMGVFEVLSSELNWLKENGLDEKSSNEKAPADAFAVLLGAAKRSIADKKNIVDLLPVLKRTAENTAQQPGAENITLFDLLRTYSVGQYDPNVPIAVDAIKTDKLIYPLDTVNGKVWQLLETKEMKYIKAQKDGSETQLSINYSIDFDALGDDIAITRQLTSFDKRLYIAAGALHDAGNEYVTITKLYEMMGYNGNPPSSDIDKINSALIKMGKAWIKVDNQQESAVYNYPHFVYDGPLLPFERVSLVVNGKTTDSAIHLFREPPLITFAKQRKQLTTIGIKLLQSPVNKTESNLAIDNYLIERIARAAKNKQPQRILYKTLYDKTNIQTAKQKQRAPEKIKKYLEHYKKCDYIAGYTMESDGITVYFKKGVTEKN